MLVVIVKKILDIIWCCILKKENKLIIFEIRKKWRGINIRCFSLGGVVKSFFLFCMVCDI